MSGLIHIYEGDGKGKTSAGIGLSVRCAGNGDRVLYTQFLKGNDSSELRILEQIEEITVARCEKCFGFTFQMTAETRKQAEEYYTAHFRYVAEQAIAGEYRLVVLDELIDAYNRNMVERREVLDFLKHKPRELEVALTGRNPAEELIALADYISYVTKVRHPFDKGIPARRGIEL